MAGLGTAALAGGQLEGVPSWCWCCQFLVLAGEVLVQEMWAACATAAVWCGHCERAHVRGGVTHVSLSLCCTCWPDTLCAVMQAQSGTLQCSFLVIGF